MYYDTNAKIVLSANASSYGLGAVLKQEVNNCLHPVAYASRSLTATEQRYAQIEKEALALTWACEKFRDYLIGLTFDLETDPNLFSACSQRRIWMNCLLDFNDFVCASHGMTTMLKLVSGENLIVPDVLSRLPLSHFSERDEELLKEVETYIDAVTALVPATDKPLWDIREGLLSDATCSKVIDYCSKGWPHIISADLVPFKRVVADLSCARGLLLKGDRLAIPKMLRYDVVKDIHEGHQGISKYCERANSAVWRPGINQQLAEFVTKCPVCTKYRQINAEPMMPSHLPRYPWQKVGCDLFQFNNATYLLMVDYFSRYIEIAPLGKDLSSEKVINHLRSIFARHRIAEELRSVMDHSFLQMLLPSFAIRMVLSILPAVPTFLKAMEKRKEPCKQLRAYCKNPLIYTSRCLLIVRLRSSMDVPLPSFRWDGNCAPVFR